jgi:hypothetical protein
VVLSPRSRLMGLPIPGKLLDLPAEFPFPLRRFPSRLLPQMEVTNRCVKKMNSPAKSANATPTLTISAIISLLGSLFVASPTPDLAIIIVGIAIAFIPFLIMLAATIRILRNRGIHLSSGIAIGLGIGIGLSAVLLSILVSRIVALLTA